MNKTYFDMNSNDHWNSIPCMFDRWWYERTPRELKLIRDGNPFTRPLLERKLQLDYTSSNWKYEYNI